jgi:hypothetical protein
MAANGGNDKAMFAWEDIICEKRQENICVISGI